MVDLKWRETKHDRSWLLKNGKHGVCWVTWHPRLKVARVTTLERQPPLRWAKTVIHAELPTVDEAKAWAVAVYSLKGEF